MVAVEKDGIFQPKIKISENAGKITNPGKKCLYRVYDRGGKAVADLLTLADEKVDLSVPYRYIDPQKPWEVRYFRDCTAKPLQQLVIKDGKRTFPTRPLDELRDFVEAQLETEIWQEEQRFENPHCHFVDMSPEYYSLKMGLLNDDQLRHGENTQS